ncbi:hypothetical protein N5T95_10820 [Aliarcobacter cryaerophilus]|uniref:hypothetical protein n=1 Tax=Aliarcobacter cryaerophilus TaxID=28198 RepID=UPI0021B543E6|nr:hypothetical protein [Aliarcobacter cryaerophilus]MCT7536007.1 hypothetical protein [Aliarcobacter cryaerophilus]
MLPVLPLILGGAALGVAGFIYKDKIGDKLLDNADNVFDTVDNIIGKTESWLDDKQVALDKYLDKLEPNKDLLNSVTTSESLELSELDSLRVSVYENSFTNFANYFNNLNLDDTNLAKFVIEEDSQETLTLNEQSFTIDKPAIIRLQRNEYIIGTQFEVNQAVEFLNKANQVLESVNSALQEDVNKELEFSNFSEEKQNLIKEGYDLAKKIEKLCLAKELKDTYTRITVLYVN